MAFKLLIECSKDIDELHINFSDGTSVVTHTPDKPKKKLNTHEDVGAKKKEINKPFKKDKFINTDVDYSESIDTSIINKPNINKSDRPIIVADELQNLNI